MKRIESRSKEEKKNLVLGVDNRAVMKWLRKGRGMCGEAEQGIRKIGRRLREKDWEIWIEWVPGHVGVEENKEVDELAKEGVWGEEKKETENVCSWQEWEYRRKKNENRRWREYWEKDRKGEEYFGVGGRGELGHDRGRWVSRMLVCWRSNHGNMRGARYRRGEKNWECGEEEDRDHIILRYGKW